MEQYIIGFIFLVYLVFIAVFFGGIYFVIRRIMANNEKKHPTKMHESMWATFEECYETSVKKNADYCGSKNPFGNFMLSQMVGVPVERGILVRIMDKISRVNTLLDKKPEVAGESIRDSLLDLVNYAAILLAYLESKKKK